MVDSTAVFTDRLTFRIYLPYAQHVELMGTFTGWQDRAIPMARSTGDEAGWWSVDCNIPDADQEFAYLVDGKHWMPDYAADGVRRNDLGRWTSSLKARTARFAKAS